jgi:hypothetical protein
MAARLQRYIYYSVTPHWGFSVTDYIKYYVYLYYLLRLDYLTNIKHFPCWYTVISTRVELGKREIVWENEKLYGGGRPSPRPHLHGKLTNFRKFWPKRAKNSLFECKWGSMSEIWKFCRKFRRLCPPHRKKWIFATGGNRSTRSRNCCTPVTNLLYLIVSLL